MQTEEYRAILGGPQYGCSQRKKLINSSNFTYDAYGSATTINKLIMKLYISPQNSVEEKRDLSKVLIIAVNEVTAKASGQKLPQDVLISLLSGETKDFTLAPDADAAKSQIKTASVSTENIDGSNIVVRRIEFKF